MNTILNSVELEDVVIQLPKGLHASASDNGNYNATTGLLTYSKLVTSNKSLQKKITLSVSKIDANMAGLQLANGELTLETAYSIAGKIAIYGRNLKEPFDMDELLQLKQITYLLDVNFPDGNIKVNDFSGDIRYQFDGVDASSIMIDNIPDLLIQEGTDIRLANPQIYLTVNNPLYNVSIR